MHFRFKTKWHFEKCSSRLISSLFFRFSGLRGSLATLGGAVESESELLSVELNENFLRFQIPYACDLIYRISANIK